MIKKITNNLVDVFFNEGWEHHVRMRRSGKEWVYVAGDKTLAHGASVFLERKFK